MKINLGMHTLIYNDPIMIFINYLLYYKFIKNTFMVSITFNTADLRTYEKSLKTLIIYALLSLKFAHTSLNQSLLIIIKF